MHRKVICFIASIIIYISVAYLTDKLFIMPATPVTRLITFLPPILGLMWGLPAAVGIMLSHTFFTIMRPDEIPTYVIIREAISIFLMAYLPHRLWFKIMIVENEPLFVLDSHVLKKFVAIVFITDATVAFLYGFTSLGHELMKMSLLLGEQISRLNYSLMLLINDFNISIYAATPIFLVLIGLGFRFERPSKEITYNILPDPTVLKSSDYRELIILIASLTFFFFLMFTFMSFFGIISHLDSFKVWENFMTSVLILMNAVFIGFLTLLLKYKHSIMLEMIMLSIGIVFSASSILGNIGIMTVENILDKRSREDLQQIGTIQTEHMSRIFDKVELSVKNMQDFSLRYIDSYERLTNDEEYRKNYVDSVEKICFTIAENTNGITGFYFKLDDKISTQDGFFYTLTAKSRINDRNIFEKVPINVINEYVAEDPKRLDWYNIPIDRGKATWTPPYLNEHAAFYMVSYGIPIYFKGDFIGVVGMDIDIRSIIEEVSRVATYNHSGGYVYMLNSKDRRVIYHKEYPVGSLIPYDPTVRVIEIDLKNGITLAVANSIEDAERDRNDLAIQLILAALLVAVILSLISIKLSSGILSPLSQVNEAAKKIADGHLEVKINYNSQDEIGSMIQSMYNMVEQLDGYMYRDQMTGVKNNAAYTIVVKDINERIKNKEQTAFAVLVIDVNSLKYVNDNYGHDAGNVLIKHATDFVKGIFQNSTMYRTGGDEFVCVVEGTDYSNREALMKVLDTRTRTETIKFGEEDFHASVAYGLSIYDEESDREFKDVFKRADEHMYVNKELIKQELQLPSR